MQQISNCNIWQKPQVVVPRNEVKKCDNEIIKVSAESPEAHKNDRNHYDEKCNQEDEAYKEKAPACSVKTPVSEAQQRLLRAAPPLQLGGVAGRKGSLTSECSSSTELDTPRHLARLASSARWDHSGAVGPDILTLMLNIHYIQIKIGTLDGLNNLAKTYSLSVKVVGTRALAVVGTFSEY